MRIDAFYILYAVDQDSIPACVQWLSCVDRLNNLMLSIEVSRVDFSVIYARPRSYVGNPRGGLPMSFIAGLDLAVREESKPGVGYILLGDGNTTIINVTPFVSWGVASPETLIRLIQAIGQQNIRYIFVRWPYHTIEVTQDVIHFVLPLPPEFKEKPMGGKDRKTIGLLMDTKETQRYLSALWPDFEEQKSYEEFFGLGKTYIES